MTKTKEELAQIKNEYETLTNKLKELNEDELNLVTGGSFKYFTYGQLFGLKDLSSHNTNDKGEYAIYKCEPSYYNDEQRITNDWAFVLNEIKQKNKTEMKIQEASIC